VAENIRLFLRAVCAFQITFVSRIKNCGIRSNDIRVKDVAPVEVLEVVFEILQDKRIVPQESPQKPEARRCNLRIAHPGLSLTGGAGNDQHLQAILAKSRLKREGSRLNGAGLFNLYKDEKPRGSSGLLKSGIALPASEPGSTTGCLTK